MNNVRYSFIIPVYNRPAEVDELLASLAGLERADCEVIVVEDGSTADCEEVVGRYADRLDIHYLRKPNSGPGPSRNMGAEVARGEWLLIVDSDVVVPGGYLKAVDNALQAGDLDAFGGPDRARADFTPTQRAVDYAMTSWLTTGGIRGGRTRKRMDRFHPRSYNMGIRRTAFLAVGGFSTMRYGEDIDLSLRLLRAGYRTGLVGDAWVWHKRRSTLRQFFHQVHHSGQARIDLARRHPGSMRLVHALPSAFTVGCAVLLVAALWTPWTLTPLALWALLVAADATMRTRSLAVGLRAVAAAAIMLVGYGTGFIRARWLTGFRGHDASDE